MSELTDSLRAHGQRHLGTELGGLLQWAALHIDAQDEALAELREEYAREKSDRVGLEGAMGAAKEAIEAEVRKQDTEPIQQLVEALDGVHTGEHQGGVDEAITAGRARLEGKT